jgi:hypothetical protein
MTYRIPVRDTHWVTDPHRAHRGSDVEAFIKRARDEHPATNPGDRANPYWISLDMLLDSYRLHADCGVPLTEPTPHQRRRHGSTDMIDPVEAAIAAVNAMEDLNSEDIAATVIGAYEKAKTEIRLHGFHPEGSNASVRLRPQEHGNKPWNRLTVVSDRIQGGGPYQDTVNVYEVTFDGGHPSNMPGLEMAFGVPRKFNAEMWRDTTSFLPMTLERREANHYAHIKRRLKGMVPSFGWEVDLTAGEQNRMGATTLERFEFVSETAFTSTFRLHIRRPNMS